MVLYSPLYRQCVVLADKELSLRSICIHIRPILSDKTTGLRQDGMNLEKNGTGRLEYTHAMIVGAQTVKKTIVFVATVVSICLNRVLQRNER